MILLLLAAAFAQLDHAYQAGDYDRVVQLAPALLADSARTRADSSSIDRTCAFALVALGRTDEAAAVFRRLITADPAMTLDPESVSPKIRAVFEDVKAQIAPALRPPPVVRAETVYRRQPVPLSVLVPGLHQIQRGRPAAGYALAGAAALSLAGLALSHFSYNDARADYLSASTPEAIAARYRTANDWYRARMVFSGTAVASWLVSLVAALRSP